MPVGSPVVTGPDSPLRRRIAELIRDVGDATAVVDLGDTRAALAQAADVLVHISSATVYGAWPDNPLPLTEEEPLRPNPGVTAASEHAEAERLVAAWKDEHPSSAVAVLRPAMVVGPGADSGISRTLGGQPILRSDGADPVRQFVHVDDLAAAAAFAVAERLDGVFNVAADGWVTGEVVRGLSSARPSLPIPAWAASLTARWAWTLHISQLPPAFLPLTQYSWVVANDKLRAAGWSPSYTNEEAVVAGRPGGRWREMSVSRRQRATVAAAGLVVAGAAAGGVALARRLRRPR
jgi:nucleoside-diphosphate-sugar epimerase